MPPRHSISLLSICLFAGFLLSATGDEADAAIYGYTAVPEPGDTYEMAHFRIYIPDACPVVRGVYFHVAPRLVDSRSYAENPVFQALCESVDFAMMGAQLDNLHMDSGSGDALLRALDAFATMSWHPEIAHSTIFFEGYSWGGQFSYHFTKWLPARVIGFVTQKGGYHDTSFAGDALAVPGYLFIGENDLPYRIENLTGVFEAHRPLGARWILAVQPGAGHEQITDRNLLDDYFLTVAELRLPEVIPIDHPVDLLTIAEPGNWLGNRANFLIGAWDCYDAAADSACWFVSRAVGSVWQSFVSGGAVTDTIPCGPVAVLPGAGTLPAVTHLSRIHPNPFNPHTQIAFRVDRSEHVQIAVYDLKGKQIVVLADGVFEPGLQRVGWDGRDRQGRSVASGAYLVRLLVAGATDSRKITLAR